MTTPGPMVTSDMLDAGYEAYIAGPNDVRQLIADILNAALAVKPTTPKADGLADRVAALEAFTGVATMNDLEGSHRVHMERDHAPLDAALAELRDVVNQHDMSIDLLKGKCICGVFEHCSCGKGIEATYHTPPAVPDAAEDADMRNVMAYLNNAWVKLDTHDAALAELQQSLDTHIHHLHNAHHTELPVFPERQLPTPLGEAELIRVAEHALIARIKHACRNGEDAVETHDWLDSFIDGSNPPITPAPPAVADAAANRFSPFINPWAEDEAAEAAELGLTPAPPPLVVDDLAASHKRLIEAIDQFIEPIKDLSGAELSRRIGVEVNPLALVSTRMLEEFAIPAPDVSDEALGRVLERAITRQLQCEPSRSLHDVYMHGARAVRQALASSSAAVDVPERVDRVEILHEDDGNWVCSLGKWREAPFAYGAGPTIAAAIADAVKEDT